MRTTFDLARRVAEAQPDLQLVRRARRQFLSDRLSGHPRSPNKASSPNSGSLDEFATTLVEHFKELKAIDRYERRALSRGRFAVSAVDVERQNSQVIGQNHFWQNEAN
jgi:hypothetical protein